MKSAFIIYEGITAQCVTASIDLELYICEKLLGQEVREKIAKQMDYKYKIYSKHKLSI